MCFDTEATTRNIGQETRETLDAQQDAMPRQYELDSQYQPLYALLGNQNLAATLFGSGGYQGYMAGQGGGTAPVADPNRSAGPVRNLAQSESVSNTLVNPGASKTKGATPTTGGISALNTYYPDPDTGIVHGGGTTAPTGSTAIPVGTTVTPDGKPLTNSSVPHYQWNGTGWVQGTGFYDPRNGYQFTAGDNVVGTLPQGYSYAGPGSDGYTPTTPTDPTDPTAPTRPNLTGGAGLLDMFENGVTPALTRMQTSASRDLRNATMQDVTSLAPGLRSNYNAANPESAAMLAQLNELASGGMLDGLTDYETRTAQQSARQAQSARGFGYGSNDAFDEAMRLALDTQQRREANRQFGLQVQGANNATAIDPWAAITGQSSLGGGAAAAGGFYRPPAGTQFDPFSAYASDLYGSNQSASAYASAASAQANSGFWGSALEGLGSAIGGFGCWVARAVFGNDNPKWVLFRTWLEHDAPRWFRALYVKHGPAFAAWLDVHPGFKAPVRAWMEWIIRRNLQRIGQHWHTIQPA